MQWHEYIEIAANVGVIISIIFLAMQIRQNTQSMKESASLAQTSMQDQTFANFREIRHYIIANPDVAHIWFAGRQGVDLSEVDQHRFELIVTDLIIAYKVKYEAAKTVGASAYAKTAIVELAEFINAYPGLMNGWNNREKEWFIRGGYNEFADAVEQRLKTQ